MSLKRVDVTGQSGLKEAYFVILDTSDDRYNKSQICTYSKEN